MIWSPFIAKKLDEAVPPFADTPRDWNDVFARSKERVPRIRRLLGSRSRRSVSSEIRSR